MSVRVLFFAGLRDAVGTREVCIDLAPGTTVAGLRAALIRDHPALQPLLPNTAIAVNEEFADADTRLQPGDVVALIPPVSGG